MNPWLHNDIASTIRRKHKWGAHRANDRSPAKTYEGGLDVPDTTLSLVCAVQPDPDGLTSADWIDSIRWWLDHIDDAEEHGMARHTTLLCIQAAVHHAIECEEVGQ